MVDFDIAEDGDEQPPEAHDNAAHTESYTTASEAAAAAPIQDVFGRTGSVAPQSGDYTASEIANFAATALSAIDAEIDAAATSVSGLDNVTNTHIGAANPHSGSADTNHGNEAHAESYITSGEALTDSGDVVVTDTQPGTMADGEVLVNSGGNLTGGATGGLPFEEDGNSPISVSTNDNYSYTVAGNYERVLVIVDANQFTNGNSIRVNNETSSNYNSIELDGNKTANSDKWVVGPLERIFSFEIGVYQGEFGQSIAINVNSAQNSTSRFIYGTITNAGSSINSFSIIDTNGYSQDINARVFGLKK